MVNRFFSCESQAAINELRSRLETQAAADAGFQVIAITRTPNGDALDMEAVRSAAHKALDKIVTINQQAAQRSAELEAEND